MKGGLPEDWLLGRVRARVRAVFFLETGRGRNPKDSGKAGPVGPGTIRPEPRGAGGGGGVGRRRAGPTRRCRRRGRPPRPCADSESSAPGTAPAPAAPVPPCPPPPTPPPTHPPSRRSVPGPPAGRCFASRDLSGAGPADSLLICRRQRKPPRSAPSLCTPLSRRRQRRRQRGLLRVSEAKVRPHLWCQSAEPAAGSRSKPPSRRMTTSPCRAARLNHV